MSAHARRYSRIGEWTTRNDAYVPRHRRVSLNDFIRAIARGVYA